MSILTDLKAKRDEAIRRAAEAKIKGDTGTYLKSIEEGDFWISLIRAEEHDLAGVGR